MFEQIGRDTRFVPIYEPPPPMITQSNKVEHSHGTKMTNSFTFDRYFAILYVVEPKILQYADVMTALFASVLHFHSKPT